jgi:hypothetical protein
MLPSLSWDNSFFLVPPIKFYVFAMFELFGESMIFMQGKAKSRKLSIVQGPSALATNMLEPATCSTSSVSLNVVGQKRKKSTAKENAEVPSCTNQARRSPRCNKYHGLNQTLYVMPSPQNLK